MKNLYCTEPPKKNGEQEFTMYHIDYINFTHNDGDYMLCRDISDVAKILEEVEHILDSEPDDADYPYSVTVSPVVMTEAQYTKFYVEVFCNTEQSEN